MAEPVVEVVNVPSNREEVSISDSPAVSSKTEEVSIPDGADNSSRSMIDIAEAQQKTVIKQTPPPQNSLPVKKNTTRKVLIACGIVLIVVFSIVVFNKIINQESENIYIIGHNIKETDGMLWINGIPQRSGIYWPDSVYVSGNDIYVAGFGTRPNTGDNVNALLWVNGNLQILNNTGAAYSVYIKNTGILYLLANSV